jgi:hypothetical protein
MDVSRSIASSLNYLSKSMDNSLQSFFTLDNDFAFHKSIFDIVNDLNAVQFKKDRKRLMKSFKDRRILSN